MLGYGYSVWVIPDNYEIIKKKYKMKHIPHVTISTNHVVPPTLKDIRPIKIKLHDEFVNFPKMYENDPLKASGFYCEIDYPTKHRPHMTVYYEHLENCKIEPPKEKLEGIMYVVDTTSCDATKWKIINKDFY